MPEVFLECRMPEVALQLAHTDRLEAEPQWQRFGLVNRNAVLGQVARLG